jgi:chemotaxis protein methyltransferase CheR
MQAAAESEQDFDFIIDLVYQRSRIRLHAGKKPLIRARLGKRLRARGLASISEYCDYLRSGRDEGEITALIDALTTNFTHFLREEKHFEYVVKDALPQLLKKQKSFRVWCAACATGEEPYTLAMYFNESFPLAAGWDWRIEASDISTKALQTAGQGIYSLEKLNSVPREWLHRYFQKGEGKWHGHGRIKPQLRERIEFQQINLLGNYPFKHQFEVIFCRNVMIYFDRPTQEQLVNRLYQCLRPEGYLAVGHSESLAGLQLPLQTIRPSLYRKA